MLPLASASWVEAVRCKILRPLFPGKLQAHSKEKLTWASTCKRVPHPGLPQVTGLQHPKKSCKRIFDLQSSTQEVLARECTKC